MEKRFGDEATVTYHNVQESDTKDAYPALLEEIETKGLLYPVTVMNAVPIYDGAVSYPAILRAVQNKLAEARPAEA